IIGDRATDAAIRQFENVVVRAGNIAAAQQHIAVDAELAELVDDDRQPVTRRGREQVAHEARLAGPEKPGDDRRGNAPHGQRASVSPSGRPAATKTTRAASAATAWLSRPASSRKRRPSGVSGTSPSPTSLATSTTGPPASRNAVRSERVSSSMHLSASS